MGRWEKISTVLKNCFFNFWGFVLDMGRFSFLTSLSSTKLLQSLQKLCAEKGLGKEGGVWGGRKWPFLKRALLPPQLPQPLLSTFVGNRAYAKRRFPRRTGQFRSAVSETKVPRPSKHRKWNDIFSTGERLSTLLLVKKEWNLSRILKFS